jgi:hypothetical protein
MLPLLQLMSASRLSAASGQSVGRLASYTKRQLC